MLGIRVLGVGWHGVILPSPVPPTANPTYRSGMELTGYLSYRDAPRALDWLTAIGFEVVVRLDGPEGRVEHAEVRAGDATIMVSTSDRAYEPRALLGSSTGGGLYLLVRDVDAVFARAVDAGGAAVIRPEDTDWGGRRARVLDPEGNEWSFGTYRPGGEPSAQPGLKIIPLVHVDRVHAAVEFFAALGAEVVARAPEGDFARLRFPSGDELQVLGHPPNPEQDPGLVELTAVASDLAAVQDALARTAGGRVEAQPTAFGRQALYRIPGGGPQFKVNAFGPAPDAEEEGRPAQSG
ncbi:Putative glyoxalase superfamily protein PhnB OS=Leifsonia shinshuensis OX=150026 GN=HNR13_000615 PE=4 SV=1 [Leifsonia shinshuensis]